MLYVTIHTMDKASLVAKRDALQPRFDQVTTQKTESEQEQYRLQGEFRLLNQLIEELEQSESPAQEDSKKVPKIRNSNQAEEVAKER